MDGERCATEIWEKMKGGEATRGKDEEESEPLTETTFLLECGSGESL